MYHKVVNGVTITECQGHKYYGYAAKFTKVDEFVVVMWRETYHI